MEFKQRIVSYTECCNEYFISDILYIKSVGKFYQILLTYLQIYTLRVLIVET